MRALLLSTALLPLAACEPDCHEFDVGNVDVREVRFQVTIGRLDYALDQDALVAPGDKATFAFTRTEDGHLVEGCSPDPIIQDPSRAGEIHLEVRVYDTEDTPLGEAWSWTADGEDYVATGVVWDGAIVDWEPDDD